MVDDTVYVWRVVPRWSVNTDLDTGIGTSQAAAKTAVETAMRLTEGFAAIIYKLGLDAGEWIPLAKPALGVRTQNGSVKWFDS